MFHFDLSDDILAPGMVLVRGGRDAHVTYQHRPRSNMSHVPCTWEAVLATQCEHTWPDEPWHSPVSLPALLPHACMCVPAQFTKLCRSPRVGRRLTEHGKRDQVSYVPPFLEENGRGLGYFFINVTVACTKHDGADFKNISQVSHCLAEPHIAFLREEQVATRSSAKESAICIGCPHFEIEGRVEWLMRESL